MMEYHVMHDGQAICQVSATETIEQIIVKILEYMVHIVFYFSAYLAQLNKIDTWILRNI